MGTLRRVTATDNTLALIESALREAIDHTDGCNDFPKEADEFAAVLGIVQEWRKNTETPTDDVIPYDLRLSFTPDAIREHFEGDEPDPTEGMTDEQLTEVGRTALVDEGLYRAFHESLTWALTENDG
jgi:hypothetical protein